MTPTSAAHGVAAMDAGDSLVLIFSTTPESRSIRSLAFPACVHWAGRHCSDCRYPIYVDSSSLITIMASVNPKSRTPPTSAAHGVAAMDAGDSLVLIFPALDPSAPTRVYSAPRHFTGAPASISKGNNPGK